MTQLIIAVAVSAIVTLLVLLYGKSQKKVGSLGTKNEEPNITNERERKAKDIESNPAPNTSDDVADAWSGMQYNSKKQS